MTDINGISTTTTRGETWTSPSRDLYDAYLSDIAVTPYAAFVSTWGSGILKSTNQGFSWSRSDTGISGTSISGVWYDSRNDEIYAIANNQQLYKSTNRGSTWNLIFSSATYNYVSDLLFDNQSSSTLYACGEGGALKSTTGGSSWQVLTDSIRGSFIEQTPSGTLFIGSYTALYKSTNFGNSWISVTNGLPQPYPALYDFLAITDDLLYASGDSVFRSTDGGTNWASSSTGSIADHGGIYSLSVDQAGYLYAGTYGGGVYTTQSPVTSVFESPIATPLQFKLDQNFPNPFNPSTTINFSIPHSGIVTLKLFNTLGQEVATLLSEQLGAGFYSTTLNLPHLATGVYFYRLQTANLSQTRKLILLR